MTEHSPAVRDLNYRRTANKFPECIHEPNDYPKMQHVNDPLVNTTKRRDGRDKFRDSQRLPNHVYVRYHNIFRRQSGEAADIHRAVKRKTVTRVMSLLIVSPQLQLVEPIKIVRHKTGKERYTSAQRVHARVSCGSQSPHRRLYGPTLR